MGFWWFMLFMTMLTPLSMLGFGLLLWKKPPKDINGLFGYRTDRSMKSPESWDFAQRYSGRLWVYLSVPLVFCSVVAMGFGIGRGEDFVGWLGSWISGLSLIVMLVSIWPTERALKKNFDSWGRPIKPESQERKTK